MTNKMPPLVSSNLLKQALPEMDGAQLTLAYAKAEMVFMIAESLGNQELKQNSAIVMHYVQCEMMTRCDYRRRLDWEYYGGEKIGGSRPAPRSRRRLGQREY